jgi:hypothetical protein
MNIRTTSTPTMSGTLRRPGRKSLIGALAAVLAVAAVVTAAFIAQPWLSTKSSTHANPPVSAATSAGVTGITSARPSVSLPSPTLYVVGDDGQAAQIEQGINDANAIRGNLGEPPFFDSVIVLPSYVAASELALGVPGDMMIVDLRGSDSPSVTAPSTTPAGPANSVTSFSGPVSGPGDGHTLYIAGSAEQADNVMAAINDASAIRFASNMNEAPAFDSVVVATSDVQAAEMTNAIAEGNLILADLGQPEVRVVDLRGN